MKQILRLAFLIVVISGCSEDKTAKPSTVEAYIVAKELVKANLKDPDGAEFVEGNRKEAEYKDSSFVFRGYVKATNGLGLKSPIEYNVGIKWKGGYWMSDTSWTIKFAHLGNPDL